MPTERRPTLLDVAASAGVSFKTVSRVINREPGVSEALRERVEIAISELGYRPDIRARGLRRSEGGPVAVGFILPDVSNPFFSSIFRGIEEVAIERDCLVLSGSTERSSERERQLLDAFLGRRVDGLIVVASGREIGPLEAEVRRGTPLVFLDIEPDIDHVDLVRSDHRAGAIKLTEHLLRRGHTDIAFFGDDLDIFSARLRLDGFQHAIGRAGLSVHPDRIISGSYGADEWRKIALGVFDAPPYPTAVFSAQNLVTLGVAGALHQLSLHEQIAQVGFDDVELGDVVQPGITVISQRPRELGRRAAELLFARIDGDNGPPNRQVIAGPLIERGSGEIAPD